MVSQRRVLFVHVDGVHSDIGNVDNLRLEAVDDDPLVLGLAKHKWFAVFEHQLGVGLGLPVKQVTKSHVIEDVAVLVDLNQRGALVLKSAGQHLGHVLGLTVDGPRHKCRVCTECQRERPEGVVQGAHRRGLGVFADLGGGGVLAFGKTVDLVVEKNDVDVEVSPERVNQVVAPDGKGVAITGDDPHAELWASDLEPGRDCGCAPVDGVEAVRVHVVGEAA